MKIMTPQTTKTSSLSIFHSERAIMPCHKPDCNAKFHDNDVRDLHFVRMHHDSRETLPKAIVNEDLTATLKNYLEAKKIAFKKPPRKPEPVDDKLLSCPNPSCDLTFTTEELRDFHNNRMHHSRQPSMLSRLEGEDSDERRRVGYECLKADCDSRFLNNELRDFHCKRVHPMLWKAIQDCLDSAPKQQGNFPGLTSLSEPDEGGTGKKESVKVIDVMVMKVNSIEASETFEGEEGDSAAATVKHPQLVRPGYQYRLRSQHMMNRNVLANPGASNWAVQY
jgi:hypothetical protein